MRMQIKTILKNSPSAFAQDLIGATSFLSGSPNPFSDCNKRLLIRRHVSPCAADIFMGNVLNCYARSCDPARQRPQALHQG
jgi:hypothetical protein